MRLPRRAEGRASAMKLVIVGGGFTGAAVARRALGGKSPVFATTRSADRARSLTALGVVSVLSPTLDPNGVRALVDESTRVVVTIPPDGATDAAIAPCCAHAAAIVYVSSTGVYGDASGRVDETTAIDPGAPRALARLAAEHEWRTAGATVVRAPAIYGPGRGMHLRLARGELIVAGSGSRTVSRVHVDDLAFALCAVLERGARDAVYVMGDLAPAPHIEVVQWLCDALGIPPPVAAPDAIPDETLSHDRRVDSSRIRSELAFDLAYPTYREGYLNSLRADREQLDQALALRGHATKIDLESLSPEGRSWR